MRRACSPTIRYRGSSVNRLEHHTIVGEGFEVMFIFEHQECGISHCRVLIILVCLFIIVCCIF
jgi:hypothetical protein